MIRPARTPCSQRSTFTIRRSLVTRQPRLRGGSVTTFLGLLLADGVDLTDVSVVKAAAVAAIPAALSVVKAAVGSLIGDPRTVGWLPGRRL
ncbi:hypothetical protein ACFWPV_25605 [Streptomyces uncialis]|uniref:hypothetical protein n=1 Tax=Streptomyces uncialis TaxID=1048205 RepID=UPI00365E7DBF